MGDSLMNDIQNDLSEFSVGLEINREHMQKQILDDSQQNSMAAVKSHQASVSMMSTLLISDSSSNDEFSKFIEMPSMDSEFHSFSTQLNLQQSCVVELPPRPDSGGDSGPDTEPDAELSLSYVSANRQRSSDRCSTEDMLFGRHNSEGDDSMLSVVGNGTTSFLSVPVSSTNTVSQPADQFNSTSSSGGGGSGGIGFASDSHTKYPGELLRLVDHLVKENQSLKAQINYSGSVGSGGASAISPASFVQAHSVVSNVLESDAIPEEESDAELLIPKGGFLQSLHESDELVQLSLPSSQPLEMLHAPPVSKSSAQPSPTVCVQAAAAAGVTPEYLAQLSSKTAALYGPGRVMLMNNQFVFVPDTQPALAAAAMSAPVVQQKTPVFGAAGSSSSSTIPVSLAATASGCSAATAAGQQMMVTGHVSGGCVYISLPPGVNASSILSVGGQVVNSANQASEKQLVIGPSATKVSSAVHPPAVKPSPSKKSASTYRLQPVTSAAASASPHTSALALQNNANRRLRKLLPRDAAAAAAAAQPMLSNAVTTSSASCGAGGFYSTSDAVCSAGVLNDVSLVSSKGNNMSSNNSIINTSSKKKKKKTTLTLQDISANGSSPALLSQTLVPAVATVTAAAASAVVQQPTHANVVYQATPQGYQPVLATPQGYGTVQWSTMPYQLSMTSTNASAVDVSDKLALHSSSSSSSNNKLDILHQAMMEMGGDFFTIDGDGVIESSLHQPLDNGGCITDGIKVDESVDLSATVDPIDLDQLINTFSASENDADNKVFEESLSVSEMVSLESISNQISSIGGGGGGTKKSRSRPNKVNKKDAPVPTSTSCGSPTVSTAAATASALPHSFLSSLEQHTATTLVKPQALLQSLDSDQCGATMQQFHEALLDFESPPFSQAESSMHNESCESAAEKELSMQLHLQPPPSPSTVLCPNYHCPSMPVEHDVKESQLNQQLRQPLTIDTSEMPHTEAELLSLPSGLLSELGVETVSPNKLSLTTPNKVQPSSQLFNTSVSLLLMDNPDASSSSMEMKSSPDLMFESFPLKSSGGPEEHQKLRDELDDDELLKSISATLQEYSSSPKKRSSPIKIKRPSFFSKPSKNDESDGKFEDALLRSSITDATSEQGSDLNVSISSTVDGVCQSDSLLTYSLESEDVEALKCDIKVATVDPNPVADQITTKKNHLNNLIAKFEETGKRRKKRRGLDDVLVHPFRRMAEKAKIFEGDKRVTITKMDNLFDRLSADVYSSVETSVHVQEISKDCLKNSGSDTLEEKSGLKLLESNGSTLCKAKVLLDYHKDIEDVGLSKLKPANRHEELLDSCAWLEKTIDKRRRSSVLSTAAIGSTTKNPPFKQAAKLPESSEHAFSAAARHVNSQPLGEVKTRKKDSKRKKLLVGKKGGSNSSYLAEGQSRTSEEDHLKNLNEKKPFRSNVVGGAPISPLFPSMDICAGITLSCSTASQPKASSHDNELLISAAVAAAATSAPPEPELVSSKKLKYRAPMLEASSATRGATINLQSPQEKERIFMTPEESAELEDFVDLPQITTPLSVITEPSSASTTFQQKSSDVAIFGSCSNKSGGAFTTSATTTFGQYALDEMPTFGAVAVSALALITNKSKASLFESENSFADSSATVSTAQDGLEAAMSTNTDGGGGGGGWYDHKGKQITSPNKVLFAEVRLPAVVEAGTVVSKRRGRKPNLKTHRRRDAAKVSPIKLKRPVGGTQLRVVERRKTKRCIGLPSEVAESDKAERLLLQSEADCADGRVLVEEDMSSPEGFAEHGTADDEINALESFKEVKKDNFDERPVEPEENFSCDVSQPPPLSFFSIVDSHIFSHPRIKSASSDSLSTAVFSPPMSLPQLSPLLSSRLVTTTTPSLTSVCLSPQATVLTAEPIGPPPLTFSNSASSSSAEAADELYDEQQLAADSEQLFGKDNLMRDFSTYQKSTLCKKKRSNNASSTLAARSSIVASAITSATVMEVKESTSVGSNEAARRPRKFFSTRRDDRRSASVRSIGAQEPLEKIGCVVEVKQSCTLLASAAADVSKAVASAPVVVVAAAAAAASEATYSCKQPRQSSSPSVASKTMDLAASVMSARGAAAAGKRSPRTAVVVSVATTTASCTESLAVQASCAHVEFGGGEVEAAIFDFEDEGAAGRAAKGSKGKKKESVAAGVSNMTKRKRGRPPKHNTSSTPMTQAVEDLAEEVEDACHLPMAGPGLGSMPKLLLKLKIKRDQSTSNFSVSEAADGVTTAQELDDSVNDDNGALVVDEDADERREEIREQREEDLLTVEDDPQPFKEHLPDSVTELSVSKELNQHYEILEHHHHQEKAAIKLDSGKKHKEPKKKRKKDKKNKERDKNKEHHHHHKKKSRHLRLAAQPEKSMSPEESRLTLPSIAFAEGGGGNAMLPVVATAAVFDAKSPELLTKITRKTNSEDAATIVPSSTVMREESSTLSTLINQNNKVAAQSAPPTTALGTSARTSTPCALPKKRKLNLPSSSGLSPPAPTARTYESLANETDPAQKRSRPDLYQQSPLTHLEVSLGSVPVSTPTVWDYGASSALAAAAILPLHAAKVQQEDNRLFHGSPPPPSTPRSATSHNHNLELSQSLSHRQQQQPSYSLAASQNCADSGGRSSRSPAPPNLTHFGVAAAAAAAAVLSSTASDRSTPQHHMPTMSRNWLSGGLPVSSSLLNFELDSNIPDIRETLAAAAAVAVANKCSNGSGAANGTTSLFGNQLPPPPSISRPPPPPVQTHVPTRGQPPPAHSSTAVSSRPVSNSSPYVYEAPPPPPSDTWARAMAASRPYGHDYSNYYSVMYSAAVQQQLQLQYQQQWYAAAANDEVYQQQVNHVAAATASANAGGSGSGGPTAAVAYQQQHHPASLYGLYGAATAAAANMHHHHHHQQQQQQHHQQQHPSHHPFN